MTSWSSMLALTDFHYSGVSNTMSFTSKPGTYFWSNGYAWGTCEVEDMKATVSVFHGQLPLSTFILKGTGSTKLKNTLIKAGESKIIQVKI